MLTIAEKINENYYFSTYDEFIEVENKNFISGKLAERLNLNRVDRHTLHYILSLREKKQKNNTTGIDLTFSAPKSVSILYSLIGDEKVLQAHVDAVKHALSYVEENLNTTRIKENKKTKYVKSELAFLCINHFFSRELDMQLHTHCILPSVVFANGKYYSLDNREIFKQQQKVGRIYREKLAENLKKLGYQIEIVDASKFFFEIKGIDKSVISLFSTRNKEIQKQLEETLRKKNITNSEIAVKFEQIIKYTTRKKKKTIQDIEEIKKIWELKLQMLNLTVEDLKKSVNNELVSKSREEIEKNLFLLAEEYFRIKNEVDKKRIENSSLEQLIEEAHKRAEELKRQREEEEKKLLLLAQEIEKVEEEKRRKQVEVLSLEAQINNSILMIRKADEIIYEKQKEIEEIDKKLNERQSEMRKLEQLEKVLKEIEERNRTLKAENSTLEERNRTLKTENSIIESRIRTLRETLQSIEKAIPEKQKYFNKLIDEVALLEKKEKIIKDTQKNLIDTSKKLVNENEKLKKENSELEKEINELENRKRELANEIEEINSLLLILKQRLKVLIQSVKENKLVYEKMKDDNIFKKAESIIDNFDDDEGDDFTYYRPRGPRL